MEIQAAINWQSSARMETEIRPASRAAREHDWVITSGLKGG
jgi:hypothetical protein